MASEYLKWKYRDVKPDEKPTYTKKELRRNWWDYNLIWVIVGVIAVIAAGFLIRDMFFRAKPDYEVALVTTSMPEEETQDALRERLQELGEDLNGDGRVLVELYTYDMGFTERDYQNVEMAQANVTRLTVDLSSGDVYLILLQDPQGFQERFGALSYLDGTVPDGEAEGYEAENWRDMVYRWSDCPVLKNMDLGTFTRFLDMSETQIDGQTAMEELYVAHRGMFSEKDSERFAGAARLWEKLTEGAVKAEG